MNLGKHFVICDFKYKMRAATAITALHAAESAQLSRLCGGIGRSAPQQLPATPVVSLALQAKLLGASQESFNAGYAINLSLIEQQTYLAQAQTTEVMAKAAWLKAAVQLDRVLGRTLEKSGISLKADQTEVDRQQH